MRHLRSALCSLCLAATAVVGVGCAHPGGGPARDEQSYERRLLVLESEFAEFSATALDRNDDGRPLSAPEAMSRVELQTATLEAMRLRYLDVVEGAATHRQRLVAMVRLAELHLDLGARIRRVRYPSDAGPTEQREFDAQLSRLALPYEAVGLGVLEQVVEYAERRNLDGRFIRRAQVYLVLHGRVDRPLERDEIATLRRELTSPAPFGAPRRLLEAGRVGQRAARR